VRFCIRPTNGAFVLLATMDIRAKAKAVRRWHEDDDLFRPSKRFREKRRPVMGGFGSGRPSGARRSAVDACRSIDVNRLQKAGCLRAGWFGGWEWRSPSHDDR
jgi:hypothetical protein